MREIIIIMCFFFEMYRGVYRNDERDYIIMGGFLLLDV